MANFISRLSVYYRSTSLGPPNCGDHVEPYINAADVEAAEQDVVERLIEPFENEDDGIGRKKWDWDLFQIHNHVWRRTTTRLQREGESILKGSLSTLLSLLYAHILYGLRTTLAKSCPSCHAACTLLQWLNVPVSSYVEVGVLQLPQCVDLSLNSDDHIFVPKYN